MANQWSLLEYSSLHIHNGLYNLWFVFDRFHWTKLRPSYLFCFGMVGTINWPHWTIQNPKAFCFQAPTIFHIFKAFLTENLFSLVFKGARPPFLSQPAPGNKLKKHLFSPNFLSFLLHYLAKLAKNVLKASFNQCLACAAPKTWLKLQQFYV